MNWFHLSLIAVFFFTVLSIVSRATAAKSQNPRAMSVLFNFSAIVMTVLMFVLSGQYKNFHLPTSGNAWIGLVTAIIFYGCYERVRFFASKHMEASTLMIVGTLSVVIAFVVSVFLYKESISFMKGAGAFFIISSIIIVSLDGKLKITKQGWFYGILSSVFIGIAWALDKLGADNFNPETYNIMVWTGPFLFAYLLPRVKLAEIIAELKRIGGWVLVLAASNVIGYYFQLKAFSIGEATKVIPVVQISVLTTVLTGIFILNEKTHMVRKVAAAAIGLIGVYILL